MNEYSFLLMFALVVAGIVIGVVITLILRTRFPQTEQSIGQALLLIALALRATFDEAEVRAVAGWIYDNTMVSQHYEREAWIALALRVFNMLPQQTAEAAQAASATQAASAAGLPASGQ